MYEKEIKNYENFENKFKINQYGIKLFVFVDV